MFALFVCVCVLKAGLPEASREDVNLLWTGVIGITLNDPHVREAVAKGAMPSEAEDDTMATDREMEVSQSVSYRKLFFLRWEGRKWLYVFACL